VRPLFYPAVEAVDLTVAKNSKSQPQQLNFCKKN